MQSDASRAWLAGRGLLVLAAFTYGVLPAIIDTVDPHHLTNPDWPPHARLHLLWLICSGVLLSLFSAYLCWSATPSTLERLRIGAGIGACHVVAFFLSGALGGLAGAAFDADGRAILGILPPNILHFLIAAALLGGGYLLAWRGARLAGAGDRA